MDGVKPRKHMAGMKGSMEGASGDFGVEKLHTVNQGSGNMMDHPHTGKVLEDGGRSGPPHIKRGGGMMPATAHSDHGPHQLPPGSTSFGVDSMKKMNG